MKYRDLVQFDPIETVIELRDASTADKAKKLVSTYVISDAMARHLADVVAANLSFAAFEAKGLFIVGNYGTGKSHLMAVVSALAENAALLPELHNERVREAFESISGRYLVCRFEIGAVKTPLQDIVTRELEKSLKAWGVEYKFPPSLGQTNHKEAIEAMLAAVEQRHPGKGVLLVIDELLDYLRALGEGAISAFNFLRELGEASGNGRFRTIAGVQESLVSSPSFGFLADLIQRVSARFSEIWITRDDLAFVVESRLLAKSSEQQAKIRAHLERFMPLFPTMSQRSSDFVRLFPIHPRYIEVFEEIEIAEKREVLKTLSREINRRLDEDVPETEPGLISYDSYWRIIKDTPTYLAHPDVGQVEQRSGVIAGKVQTSLAKPVYKPAALRIVDALSVFRLAVGGIRQPIGLTPANLRDDLALMLPVPEPDPDFLRTTIESVLKDIRLAVGGQFINANDITGQYFLDVDRSIDYDAEVEKKVRSLEPTPERFDRFYFDILTRVLEMPANTHVAGFRIWPHEVEWLGHRVKRPGYIFFGSPNERSTAQPPRTFYLYFLAHFAPASFQDGRRDDEVFLRLARPDADIMDRVKRYGAASELALVSTGEEKAQYTTIAQGHQRAVSRWLFENLVHAFDVTVGGVATPVTAAISGVGKATSLTTPRDVVDALASAALEPSFERRFPGYPRFTTLSASVTEQSRPQSATEGLKYIAGLIQTAQGAAVLDGLGLRNGTTITTDASPYAKRIREALAPKAALNHVLNRSELIETIDQIDVDPVTHLESEWVAVVLLAMAFRGEIEITAGVSTIDAATLPLAAQMGAEQLGRFKSIQRPRIPEAAAIKALFELFGLSPALPDVDPEKAVKDLQTSVAAEVQAVLTTMNRISSAAVAGALLWDGPDAESTLNQLSTYKDFLDRLGGINTAGKLKLFRPPAQGMPAMQAARSLLKDAQARIQRGSRLDAAVGYLKDGQGALQPDDPWQATAAAALSQIADAMTSDEATAQALHALNRVKSAYSDRYLQLHDRVRLDDLGDQAKVKVMQSKVMVRLSLLEGVQLLHGNLADMKTAIARLKVCRHVSAIELTDRATCPICYYKPSVEGDADARQSLAQAEARLVDLNNDWSTFLRDALNDPIARDSLKLLGAEAEAAVQRACDSDDLPSAATIQQINQALSGLQKVVISEGALIQGLRAGGPATPGELAQRLSRLVDELTAGKDQAKTRVVIE